MADEVLALARQFVDAVNAHDIDAAAACLAPGYIHHSGAGDLDVEAFKVALGKYLTSFPDLRYDVQELAPLADGHGVVARWILRGTHLGRAFDADPTGKAWATPGLSLHRIEDGRIVEDWEYGDDLAMFDAIGFTLEPPGSAG